MEYLYLILYTKQKKKKSVHMFGERVAERIKLKERGKKGGQKLKNNIEK